MTETLHLEEARQEQLLPTGAKVKGLHLSSIPLGFVAGAR
jgi:hypothetical protein